MFLIKIGSLFSGRGMVKDINQHSMCLMCPQLFKPRATIQSSGYIGEALRVMIPSNGITINGVIARVDLKKGEGAISISSTSDNSCWQKLCE